MSPKYALLVSLLLVAAPAYAQSITYKLAGGSSPVCKAIQNYLSVPYNPHIPDFRHRSAEKLGINFITSFKTNPDFKLPKGLSATQLNSFDFNNDGITDYVFRMDGAGSYHIGTWLFVVLGGQKLSFDTNNTVALSQVMGFPCQFDKIHSIKQCPPLSQVNDEAGIRVTVQNGANSWFRGRYTGMTPLIYERQTYIMLVSNSFDKGTYAVIRPYGKERYSSMCLLVPR